MLLLSFQPITHTFKPQLLTTELWFGGMSTGCDVWVLFFCSLSLLHPSMSVQQLKRCESSVSPPPSSSLLSDSWSSVPPSYRGYRLGSLFRHPHEISNFKSFLEDHRARWVKSVEFIDYLLIYLNSFYLKNTKYKFCCVSMWACLRNHVDNESNAQWQWHGFVIMWIFSVSIWVAGWILTSTEEPVGRSSGLTSQTNTSTVITSSDPRALPQHNSRMMWVTWFPFLTLIILEEKNLKSRFLKMILCVWERGSRGRNMVPISSSTFGVDFKWSCCSFHIIVFLFSWQTAEFMLCNP